MRLLQDEAVGAGMKPELFRVLSVVFVRYLNGGSSCYWWFYVLHDVFMQ